MTHDENLYAELNMCIAKFTELEEKYLDSVAQMNKLNEDIIAQKKKIFVPPTGTPISELSGQAGEEGFERFVEIAKSYGYE